MIAIAELFKSRAARSAGRAARDLYAAAVAQARSTAFYAAQGVPDTPNGRFDLISLHVHLICRRLGQGDAAAGAVAQAVFDALFADMDRNLREMGVGDLSVPKKIKALAGLYYKRAQTIEAGLQGDDAALADALTHALFAGRRPASAHCAALSAYARAAVAALAEQTPAAMAQGRVAFPSVA